jgi:hypothetical protein
VHFHVHSGKRKHVHLGFLQPRSALGIRRPARCAAHRIQALNCGVDLETPSTLGRMRGSLARNAREASDPSVVFLPSSRAPSRMVTEPSVHVPVSRGPRRYSAEILDCLHAVYQATRPSRIRHSRESSSLETGPGGATGVSWRCTTASGARCQSLRSFSVPTHATLPRGSRSHPFLCRRIASCASPRRCARHSISSASSWFATCSEGRRSVEINAEVPADTRRIDLWVAARPTCRRPTTWASCAGPAVRSRSSALPTRSAKRAPALVRWADLHCSAPASAVDTCMESAYLNIRAVTIGMAPSWFNTASHH